MTTLDPISPRTIFGTSDTQGNVRLTSTGFRYLQGVGYHSAETIYDPANLADGAGVTTTVAFRGAAMGQFTLVTFSLDLQGILLFSWVSAPDVVSVRFQNESGGALNLGSGTIQIRVFR